LLANRAGSAPAAASVSAEAVAVAVLGEAVATGTAEAVVGGSFATGAGLWAPQAAAVAATIVSASRKLAGSMPEFYQRSAGSCL
jgi:hypothetical protein